MTQQFQVGELIKKNDKLCKITSIIQYFDKGQCIGFDYLYSPLDNMKIKKRSIGYDIAKHY